MRAGIIKAFDGMDGEKKRTFHENEVIEGPMAQWAIENGHGVEVDEDEPLTEAPGKRAATAPEPLRGGGRSGRASRPSSRAPEGRED